MKINKVTVIVLGALLIVISLFFFKKIYGKNKRDLKKIETASPIIPVAIIGGGPAGLSAALYTARSGLYTVVFAGPELGGQLTKTMYVENWPGTERTNGNELMEVVRKQSEKFGAVVANDTITKVDFSTWPFTLWTACGDVAYALTVIIATGGVNRKIGIPGEDEYLGKGVAICGLCDAALFKNEPVVVIGGGDAAVQEALLAAQYAKSVTQLVAGPSMRATKCMQDRLKEHKNSTVLYNTKATEIVGDGKVVTGVKITNLENRMNSVLPATGVFIGIGQDPNTQLFKDQIACTKDGHITVEHKTQACSVEGVFVAGSAAEDTLTQAAISSGDAIKAALSAMRFLNSHKITDTYLKTLSSKLYIPKDIIDREKLTALLFNNGWVLAA